MQFYATAQQKYYYTLVTDTIHINFDNHYKLSHVDIIPFTETIKLKNKLLHKGDYKFSYSTASFSLSDSLKYTIFDTLFVTYETIKLGMKNSYMKRSLAYVYNQKYGDTLRVMKSEENAFTPESIFGSQIEKSGTIVRGFTVGTTKDFSLNSGLRLQLSGHLSKNIEVVAALTDENTPIQPEGNTANLQELDKVFIQIKHPNAIGTFGDYELQEHYGEFGTISRKLQGLLGEFNYKGQKAYISIASSTGKYTTNQFNGTDGMQGPYQLTGENNEKDIIIIAGTEKVYVDGIQMKRGERNDYTIEYSNAQLTFTPNRLITSASRITVDFEYTDRKYSRTFFGAGVQSNIFKDKLNLQFQYLREGDDKNSPIDISLSDSDKAVLAAAGDDPNKAVKSGVALATPDSQGVTIGIYQKIDTVINGQSYSFYRYNPGSPNSLYNVTFSYVGLQQGDYSMISIGNYKFVGIKQGDYSPIIFLPLPEMKQLGNFVLNYKPVKGISLDMELSGSNWDQNLFSTIDDNKNNGYARNLQLKIDPRKVEIGKINLGNVGFSYQDRYIEDRFTPIDRINPIEFNRDFNITQTQIPQNEELREFNLNYIPVKEMNLMSSYGYLKRGSNFISKRFNNTLAFTNNKTYNLNYNLDYVSSKNIGLNSSWLRQNGSGYLTIWKLQPGVDFLAENKKDLETIADTLLSTSLKYYEIDPFLKLVDLDGFKLLTKYSLRDDYAPLNGMMLKESRSTAQFFELEYTGIRQFNTTLNVTVNNKSYEDIFKKKGMLNAQTILVRSQSRFNFGRPVSGNYYYEVSTQRTAKLQRVFVKVAQGAGNYIYLGDLNHNGVADESEFQPTLYDGNYILVTVPTDQLYPVIDLKTSTRWKINYKDIFDKNSLLGKLLNPFSSETDWRVEENSQEQDYKKIYLLHFSDFQNPNKTIHGTNFIQQDLYLFENDPEFSARLRYSQSKGMDQYSGGIEQSYTRERSIRINFKMIEEMSNQTDIVNKSDNLSAPASSTDRREITSNSVTSDFSYRPQRNIEVGFKFNVGQREDDFPVHPTIIDINTQLLRFTLSFAGSGRLRIEFERDELNSNTTQNFIPFQMTEGNVVGKNFFWRFNFDYRLSANLQSTISYDGRAQGNERVVHTARAEVRAFF